MSTRLALLICTVGGVGYSPVAPGTAGSVAGLAFYAAIRAFQISPAIEGLILIGLVFAGAWSGTIAERHFGTTDPGAGVIDAVAGMLLTLYLLPVTWTVAIVGFMSPSKAASSSRSPRVDSRPAWRMGMMADDLMAAIYANLALRAAIAIAPGLMLR
jgi:phosphatidylglycerophosphatase A